MRNAIMLNNYQGCPNCGGSLAKTEDANPGKRVCAECNMWFDVVDGRLVQDGTPVSPIKGMPFFPVRMVDFLKHSKRTPKLS